MHVLQTMSLQVTTYQACQTTHELPNNASQKSTVHRPDSHQRHRTDWLDAAQNSNDHNTHVAALHTAPAAAHTAMATAVAALEEVSH